MTVSILVAITTVLVAAGLPLAGLRSKRIRRWVKAWNSFSELLTYTILALSLYIACFVGGILSTHNVERGVLWAGVPVAVVLYFYAARLIYASRNIRA